VLSAMNHFGEDFGLESKGIEQAKIEQTKKVAA
jgi:hypothetical protein